jgi:hypothetical protein
MAQKRQRDEPQPLQQQDGAQPSSKKHMNQQHDDPQETARRQRFLHRLELVARFTKNHHNSYEHIHAVALDVAMSNVSDELKSFWSLLLWLNDVD